MERYAGTDQTATLHRTSVGQHANTGQRPRIRIAYERTGVDTANFVSRTRDLRVDSIDCIPAMLNSNTARTTVNRVRTSLNKRKHLS
jgi:hypothetical protein